MKQFGRIGFIIIISLVAWVKSAVADIELAIISPRGPVQTAERWGATAAHLSQALGETVNILPLTTDEILDRARAGDVDFVLSHSAHTSALLARLDGRVLATVNSKAGPQFGGVIVARKGKGLTTLKDLQGKTIMSLTINEAAGGYIFQAYELKKAGLDPRQDVRIVEGKKQDDLVMAVLEGQADAAFVRTGLLEQMEKEGKINLSNLEIVNPQHVPGFPLALSTELYSEWCITAMPHVSGQVSDALKLALLSLSPSSPAAQKAQIAGFVDAVSLDNIKAALAALNISGNAH